MAKRLDCGGDRWLALARRSGDGPGVVFLAGFRSDMGGTKATFLDEVCARRGWAYVRFDYRGHGASPGAFEAFTIGGGLEDTLCVLQRAAPARVVLVGSSMGGWIALLAARARPQQVAGLVLIAPAPDFTERLIWRAWPEVKRRELLAQGVVLEPSDYEGPVPITRALIEDGRRHLLLEGEAIPIRVPVHILHGMRDEAVPWELSLELAARLESPHVTVELVKDGDHRLSRPEDLQRLEQALVRVRQAAAASD